MKSSYELAMERLSKSAPTVKLTNDQKKRLAELEGEYKAKIADREILIQGQIVKAVDKGDDEAVAQLEKQLVSDRKTFAAQLEEKKEQIRQGGK
jgi:hypothetical protein